jgi:hypothetical protein
MLLPEQVKPFINHPERVVRNFAVQYFYGSYNQDPELAQLVLQSMETEEYLDPSIHTRLSWAKRFALTRETAARLFQEIKVGSNFADWFEEWLTDTDLDLLEQFPDELQYLSSPTLEKIERRKTIAALSTGELWTEFQRYVAAYMPDDDECESDDEYGTWLIRELAKRPDLTMEEIVARMNAPLPEKIDGYGEVLLCELLGKLRLPEALPFFIKCLLSEDEMLSDAAVESLIQLGTAEVVQAVEPLYSSGTSGFWINAGWLLMNIKLPEAEEALIRLLREETDTTDATILASGLCKLLSVKGIPLIRELIYQDYDQGMLCLEEELYVNCLLNGKDLPEMSKWRVLIEKNFEKYDNWDFDYYEDEDYEDYEDDEDEEWPDEDDDDWMDEDYEIEDDDEDDEDDDKPEFRVEQRTVVKIGRNDPCPCGSGKKYKKCCLQ